MFIQFTSPIKIHQIHKDSLTWHRPEPPISHFICQQFQLNCFLNSYAHFRPRIIVFYYIEKERNMCLPCSLSRLVPVAIIFSSVNIWFLVDSARLDGSTSTKFARARSFKKNQRFVFYESRAYRSSSRDE